jgi:hypothetical protein
MPRLLTTRIDVTVDQDWYMATYPDARQAILAGAFGDALDHYLTIGLRDGRLPIEPHVDELWYRVRYPDVDRAIRDGTIKSAKQHYARWGYREGRFPRDGHRGATYDPQAKPAQTPHPEAALVPNAIEAERKPHFAT